MHCYVCIISLSLSLSLSPQLKVQCRSKKRAPWEMEGGSATTDHQFAYFTPEDVSSVYQYEWSTDQWKELPSCPCDNSGLVIIDGELTAVGGGSSEVSNKLFTFRRRNG